MDNGPIIVKIFTHQECVLCGISSTQDFCKPCYDHLPRLPFHHCPTCLWPVPTAELCGACLTKPPAFTRTIAAVRYTFPIDALIHALKYQSNLAVAPILVDLLIEKLRVIPEKPDAIIPMPLHPIRIRERGYNQAMELSRYLARRMGIPLLPESCNRIRHTPPQTELPWKDRRENIRKAFSCEIDLTGKHIAVVDDVMTTGATLNELAKILRQHGATAISNWVVARTLPETGSA